MKKRCIRLLCFLLLFTTGCTVNPPKRYTAEFLTLFDTVTTIVGFADSEDDFKMLANEIHDELQTYHELYDIYHDYSGVNNLKTINDNAGKAPVIVDIRIISLLEFAKQSYQETDGSINIAMGAVLQIWHNYREQGTEDPENAQLPPISLLKQAAEHSDINKIVIDKKASTVYLEDPEMRLDVGAVAKGYATEQVVKGLEKKGVSSLLLSVGGNIRAIGDKMVLDSKGNKNWNVGIQNPDKSSAQSELMLLNVNELSVVSSGIYERYYTVNNTQYHHIIDSKTLMPADYYAQFTILCADSGLADALSTAVFCMPLKEGQAYIEQLPDVEALWVMKDGTLKFSSGFEKYVKR